MSIPIRCPGCGARLIDAANGTVYHQTQVKLAPCESEADFLVKCQRCKKIIGFTKVSQKSIA